MIIKGNARGRSRQLAAHLLRRDQNEAIRVYEARGTIAGDVPGALAEMEAHGAGVDGARPLYHASISPEAHTPLTEEQIRIAVDTLEAALGLDRQPRIVVVHEKNKREHVHVVWSRVDQDRHCVISDSWNYRRHEQAARALEALFGHRPIPGSRSKRRQTSDDQQDHARWQQARSGVASSSITDEITALWEQAGSGQEFQARLEAAGYRLARGDRRAFVIIDRNGEVHSLARRIRGATSRDVRDRLQCIALGSLPSVAEVRANMRHPRRVGPMQRRFRQTALELTCRGSGAPMVQRSPRQTPGKTADVPSHITESQQPNPLRSSRRVRFRRDNHYRAGRAIIVADYAAKIASVRQHAVDDEFAAAIAALIGERDAALHLLSQREQSQAVITRASPPIRIPALNRPSVSVRRYRRWRLKK